MQHTLANEVNATHEPPRYAIHSSGTIDILAQRGSPRPAAGVQADVRCGVLLDVEGPRMSAH